MTVAPPMLSTTFRSCLLVGSGEFLVVNSREVRAIEGHQKNDFRLYPFDPPPPVLREKHGRKKKHGPSVQEVSYPAKQKWALEADRDASTRSVCEGT